jgi:hypothetical protein
MQSTKNVLYFNYISVRRPPASRFLMARVETLGARVTGTVIGNCHVEVEV